MLGAVQLKAARAPYRRGGVAFPSTAAVVLALAALDGLGLLRLVADPVITVLLGQEDDFVPVPELAQMTAEELQALIDAAPPVDLAAIGAEDVSPVELPADIVADLERLRAVETAWHADQRLLHDQGFQTLDALTSAWATDRQALADVTAELETSKADAAKLLVTIAELREAAAAPPAETPAAKAPAKPKAAKTE